MPNTMSSRPTKASRLSAALALVAVPTALSAQAAPAAPAAATGAGWTAWYGCWAATLDRDDAALADSGAATRRVCVLPAGGESVAVHTVERGRVVRTDTIDASGVRRARTREGCRGWEQASWSQDRRRVFTQSEYACEGGGTRTVRGVLALTPDGEWVDVRAMTAGAPIGVQVARFRPTLSPVGEVPAMDALRATRGMAIDVARRTASVPLTPGTVAEAVERAGANSTAALVATIGQPFTLSARDLLALKQAGVPGQVTDMMIAVSNPRVFAVAAADGRGTPRPAERVARGLDDGGRGGPVVVLRPGVYDPFWGLGYGTYGYNSGYAYGLGYGPGSAFGYSNYYPGGWFAGGVPVAIVRPATPEPRTQLTKGSGYSQEGGTPGAAAYPRSGSLGSEGRTYASPGGSGGGTSSAGASASANSGGSSSEGGRTAKPRP